MIRRKIIYYIQTIKLMGLVKKTVFNKKISQNASHMCSDVIFLGYNIIAYTLHSTVSSIATFDGVDTCAWEM